jgi:hypothetical protein
MSRGTAEIDVVSSKLWAIVVLAFLGLTFVSAAQPVQSSLSCERHKGSFSNGFSPAFDIDSIDCRISQIKSLPTIRFWGVRPYVGIKWNS